MQLYRDSQRHPLRAKRQEHQHSQRDRTSQERRGRCACFLHPCDKLTSSKRLYSYHCCSQPEGPQAEVVPAYKLSGHAVVPDRAFTMQEQLTPVDSAQRAESYSCEIPQGRAARFVIRSKSNPKTCYIFTR